MSRQKKNQYFHLTGSLKRVGKYVGQGKRHSIEVAVVENPILKKVVSVLGSEVRVTFRKIIPFCA